MLSVLQANLSWEIMKVLCVILPKDLFCAYLTFETVLRKAFKTNKSDKTAMPKCVGMIERSAAQFVTTLKC